MASPATGWLGIKHPVSKGKAEGGRDEAEAEAEANETSFQSSVFNLEKCAVEGWREAGERLGLEVGTRG